MKKQVYIFLTLLMSLAASYRLQAQIIITVSGITTEGYRGDTGLATHCQMHWPEAVALDPNGNIYIADADNNVIRMVNGAGIITTVVGSGFEAGTGEGGFGGDGGPASAARLYYPSGVALDAAGNMYIVDRYNNRVRMVNPTGIISTFAGKGTVGYTGDGAAASAAQLDSPTRVFVDAAGNVDIADAGNNVIRQVNTAGNIATIAGNGTANYGGDGGLATMALLNSPWDMTVDATGIMYIADYKNSRIRKVDLSGNISTYAGIAYPGYSTDSIPATDANIFEPTGVVTDPAGNLFFSDFANARVRRVDAVTGIITTYAGNGHVGFGGDGGAANAAEVYFPQGLAYKPDGGIYIADKGNNRVRLASATLGVGQVQNNPANLQLYPDPNNGVFNVNITSAFNEEVKVVLTNMAGQKITEINTRTNNPVEMKIDAPPGVYFLSARSAHGIMNEKVFIR